MSLPAFSADDICKLIGVTAVAVGYVVGVIKGTAIPKAPDVSQALAIASEAKRVADETKLRLDRVMTPRQPAAPTEVKP